VSGCVCHGGPLGDPRAEGRLREIVEEALAAARQGGAAAAAGCLAVARPDLDHYFCDASPRTRAQVRGLYLVQRLLDAGELEEAVGLLAGELTRSFPAVEDPRQPEPSRD